MANNQISMSKLRQIIKLHCQGNNKLKISNLTGTSRNTVKKYLAQLATLKTTWEEINKLTDQELDDLFHEPLPTEPPERIKELFDYFPHVEKQMKKRGMTLAILFKEYLHKHPGGYGETSYYKYYNIWKNRSHPSMHMQHKAGDKMFVDFAGEKLPLVDPNTGEITMMEVFVAILGASQLTYIEVVETQSLEDFISACENALHYFGGAPSAIVPDNLKSAVTKSSKYEPMVNENFEAFADHYSMAVLPARSYKPKDKSLVEGAVRISYTRIYTELDKMIFTDLKLMNEAVIVELEKHHNLLFQGRTYSRRMQFEEMEKQTLQPLPSLRFEMRKMVVITVMKNGHVCLHCDKHYYSVPYGYIGKKVRLFYSRSKVEVRYRYELIATHDRIKSPHNYTTDPLHLASQHRFITDWSPDMFLKDANAIHADVGLYIEQILLRKAHPEQAYKSCMGILSFAKRLGKERLVRACQRAHGYGVYNYKIIENILQRGLDHESETDQHIEKEMPSHENIRGVEYYQ
jgi:transposase